MRVGVFEGLQVERFLRWYNVRVSKVRHSRLRFSQYTNGTFNHLLLLYITEDSSRRNHREGCGVIFRAVVVGLLVDVCVELFTAAGVVWGRGRLCSFTVGRRSFVQRSRLPSCFHPRSYRTPPPGFLLTTQVFTLCLVVGLFPLFPLPCMRLRHLVYRTTRLFFTNGIMGRNSRTNMVTRARITPFLVTP